MGFRPMVCELACHELEAVLSSQNPVGGMAENQNRLRLKTPLERGVSFSLDQTAQNAPYSISNFGTGIESDFGKECFLIDLV